MAHRLPSNPLKMLRTEIPSESHPDLDRYEVTDLVDAFIDDQAHALEAVKAAGARIAEAVEAALPRIRAGGRLIYAGTSGRLGMLDSVELLPTFSWPASRAIALVAGGHRAVFKAVEGAEDSIDQGRADVRAVGVSAQDVVILLAASGSTPYVIGVLEAARAARALTIGIANNPGAPLTAGADIGITLDTGSELISGSTRLKAGTAQKIALNLLSTLLMISLGRVYDGLMVDVQALNEKLVGRSEEMLIRIAGCDREAARDALQRAHGSVKLAVMLLHGCSADEGVRLLDRAQGRLRSALAQIGERRGTDAA
jgi:N-acetylmuramic acid 6-phosphate etherase